MFFLYTEGFEMMLQIVEKMIYGSRIWTEFLAYIEEYCDIIEYVYWFSTKHFFNIG